MDLYNNNCKYIKDLELINSSIIGYAGDSPESQKNYFFDLQFAPAFTSVCRANTFLNNNYDSLVCAIKTVGWNNQEQTCGLFQTYRTTALEFGSKLEQLKEDTKQE